jgi:hypothetical protein
MASKSMASNAAYRSTMLGKRGGAHIKARKKKYNELRDVLMNQKINGLK